MSNSPSYVIGHRSYVIRHTPMEASSTGFEFKKIS